MPSTFAQAAASRSRSTYSERRSRPRRRELPGQRRQRLLVDLAVRRQRQTLPPTKADGTMYSGSDSPNRSRNTSMSSGAGWSRTPPDACSDRPAQQPPPHRRGPRAPATRCSQSHQARSGNPGSSTGNPDGPETPACRPAATDHDHHCDTAARRGGPDRSKTPPGSFRIIDVSAAHAHPEKTISPGAPNGTGARYSSTT